jgi:hypothetical protein
MSLNNLSITLPTPSAPVFVPVEADDDAALQDWETPPDPAPQFIQKHQVASSWQYDPCVYRAGSWYYAVVPGTPWRLGQWRLKTPQMRSRDRVAAQLLAAQAYCAVHNTKSAPKVAVYQWPLLYNFRRPADRPHYLQARTRRMARYAQAQADAADRIPAFLREMFHRDIPIDSRSIPQLLESVSATPPPEPVSDEDAALSESVNRPSKHPWDQAHTLDDYLEFFAGRSGRYRRHAPDSEKQAELHLMQSRTVYWMPGLYRPSPAEMGAPFRFDRRVILWVMTWHGPKALRCYLSLAAAKAHMPATVWLEPRFDRQIALADWQGTIPMVWDTTQIRQARQDYLWRKVKTALQRPALPPSPAFQPPASHFQPCSAPASLSRS